MELKVKKVLTFDCYGTLIDWESGIINAISPLLQKNNIQLSENDILSHFARTENLVQSEYPTMKYRHILMQVMIRIGSKLGISIDSDDIDNFGYSISKWEPFSDTVDALKILEKKYKLIIVSNIDNESIALTVKKLGVHFYRIYTAEDIGAYKPNEAVFKYVFSKLADVGFDQKDILHVAESLFHDHVPAYNLHLDSVWINRRYGKTGDGASPNVDPKYIPSLVFQSLMEFARHVQ